jgi:hypothetical protein
VAISQVDVVLFHRRTRACLALQTSNLPYLREEYPPGKLATTETRQPVELGSFRVTLALGASGPERFTTFAPTRTARAVAGTARPFTMVSVAAGRDASRLPAEGPWRGGDVGVGEAIGAADGRAGGLSVAAGRGAGAASTGLGFSRTGGEVGAETGGVDGAASSACNGGAGVAGGAAGTTSTGSVGVLSEPASVCASASVAVSIAEVTSKARLTRTMRARPMAKISGVTVTALDIASMADSGLIMPPTVALVLFLEVFLHRLRRPLRTLQGPQRTPMVDRVIAETPRRARLTRLMISPTMIDDAVTHFDAFTPDNDPYGEHDFGLVRVNGHVVLFKIDAYGLGRWGLMASSNCGSVRARAIACARSA